MKYGALSAPEGRVAVSGFVNGGELEFKWEESGGPNVKPPERKGLGQTILQDVAAAMCDRVQASYSEAGFKYQLNVTVSRIANEVIDLDERRSGEAS